MSNCNKFCEKIATHYLFDFVNINRKNKQALAYVNKKSKKQYLITAKIFSFNFGQKFMFIYKKKVTINCQKHS